MMFSYLYHPCVIPHGLLSCLLMIQLYWGLSVDESFFLAFPAFISCWMKMKEKRGAQQCTDVLTLWRTGHLSLTLSILIVNKLASMLLWLSNTGLAEQMSHGWRWQRSQSRSYLWLFFFKLNFVAPPRSSLTWLRVHTHIAEGTSLNPNSVSETGST